MKSGQDDRERHRWLVIGGSGFFGVHMSRGLTERGQEVLSYDLPPIRRSLKARAPFQGQKLPLSLEHDVFPALINRGLFGLTIAQEALVDIGTPEGYPAFIRANRAS